MSKPNNKSIKNVIEYLKNEFDIELMGQHRNLDTGAEYHAMMNYDYEDVLKLRELIRTDKLWDAES